jgi:hypothetical protein
VKTSKAELLEFFETICRIRSMEIASDKLYKSKFIRGFCHLYDGQEAVITGLTAGSTFNDSIITSYRDHALHLVRGGTVKEVIGELLGRVNGASLGIGGSMHMYKKKNNYYGGAGIVGAQVSCHHHCVQALSKAHYWRLQQYQSQGFRSYTGVELTCFQFFAYRLVSPFFVLLAFIEIKTSVL